MAIHTVDSMLLAVLSNRLDAIVSEMVNVLVRGARSSVVTSHDFSCSINSAAAELLASADGLPGHICGSHLKAQSMKEIHADLLEGDAFLHNDPYLGNTHAADHSILVPVFVDGEHLFTVSVMAHQADCGNSLPTTYMPFATDVYNEGALIFPCVRVQRDYQDVPDIIRMCKKRIRVPDVWYGDYQAMVGGARIGERRLKQLVARYGIDTIRSFISSWLDYSERMMVDAIRKLPAGRIEAHGVHDPLPGFDDGIPIKVQVTVDPQAGRVEIDLRDNIDCLAMGLNQSEACSFGNALIGLFNVIGGEVPHNAGSFRRVTVHLRDNCIVGRPQHPFSCSMATTNIGDRLANQVQSAFADIGEGIGLAEAGIGMGASASVVSGADFRRNGAPYQNQILFLNNGGPGGPWADGWTNFGVPVVAGQLMRDSVEVNELKYPIVFFENRLLEDSAGAGRRRGAPAGRVTYGPRRDPMQVMYPTDGAVNPPRGVRGGSSGMRPHAYHRSQGGEDVLLPNNASVTVLPGEKIIGIGCGGAGYGDPRTREVERVLADVREGVVSREAAMSVYGVVVSGASEDGTLRVDEAATARLRVPSGARPLA
ncbi:MAG: hydantoinase B/oxoprolinase family protein [Pseudomonadota bacterium]